MATLTIQNAHILDPICGIDAIQTVTFDYDGEDKTINGEGCYLFPSFVDVHVHFRDPGFTHKETLETGSAAALHGGFGHVVCMANTKPVMAGEEITAFYERTNKLPVHVYTVSALTNNLKGDVLVDMEDAARRGAVGFSDDGFPLENVALLKEALRRAKALDLPISLHEEDPNYVYNPGVDSRYGEPFGLKGAEAMAEYSLAARDLSLAYFIGAKLDIQHISCDLTAGLVEIFAAAGANVLGELTPHHMTMTGEDIAVHGTLAKMNPPLRTAKDRDELAKFVGKNHFAIATDHAPHTADEKSKELKDAPSGITGLETAFPLLYTELVEKEKCSLKDLITSLTKNPATFYKLPHEGVIGGDFVLFNPKEKTEIDENYFHGKSHNSPLMGRTFDGKIKGVLTKGNYYEF